MNNQLEAGLNAINSAVADTLDYTTDLVAAKCRALLRGYHARFADSNVYRPIEVEQMTVAPLCNPATQARSKTFQLAGRLDVLAYDQTNRLVVIDHKTTSQDVSDIDAPYWRQLRVEAQPSHYMLLQWLNGRKCDVAMWDVVRKPSISPKKLSKADRASAVSMHEYFGRQLSEVTLRRLLEDERETPEMYEARLTHDCTNERPDWYFQRRPVPRLDGDLLEQAQELWDYSQEIILARRHNRHGKNDGACMAYNSPCRYLGICSGYDTPESDAWQRKANVHGELPELEGDGRDVLTYSRLRCFKTCRRKHFYQYELGIEKQDEEEREALVFGHVWHEGLRGWWSYLMENEHGNDSGSPVNAAGKRVGYAPF